MSRTRFQHVQQVEQSSWSIPNGYNRSGEMLSP
jgi:hypothetical protein